MSTILTRGSAVSQAGLKGRKTGGLQDLAVLLLLNQALALHVVAGAYQASLGGACCRLWKLLLLLTLRAGVVHTGLQEREVLLQHSVPVHQVLSGQDFLKAAVTAAEALLDTVPDRRRHQHPLAKQLRCRNALEPFELWYLRLLHARSHLTPS